MKVQKQLYQAVNSDLQLDWPFWSDDKNRGLAKNPSNTARDGMAGPQNRPVTIP